MRKIILALGVLGAASAAQAADMRARMPVKAAPILAYNWGGFYVGGHVGGGFSDSSAVTTVTATGGPSSAGDSNGDAFLGGGQIGYNFQFSPSWVFGIEADVSGTNLRNGYLGAAPGVVAGYDDKIGVLGTVRGRLGYAFNNVLVYGTGGYAWADRDITRVQFVGTTVGAGPGTVETGSRFSDGYVVGGGFEYGFAPKWTAKAEYNFMDLGRDGVNFPISARTTTFDTEIHVVKLGLNYRFSAFGY